MYHYFIIHSNGCCSDDWGSSKQEVLSHYKKGQVLKVFIIY